MKQLYLCGKGLIKKLKGLEEGLKKMGIEILKQNQSKEGEDMILIQCSEETERILRTLTKVKLQG